MSMTKGYYSVIQYCPDRSRMEAANVGVLLLCPEIGFVQTQMSRNNKRINRFFGRDSFDPTRIKAAKRAIEEQIRLDSDSIRQPDDLLRFINSRGNDIVLTMPRSIKVQNAENKLKQLFQELVGGHLRGQSQDRDILKLDKLFHRPSLDGKVVFDKEVKVPKLERKLKIPYAYRNGTLNLVKPQKFSSEESHATVKAMQLAIEGDLLSRYSENGLQRKLIVVSTIESGSSTSDIRIRLNKILNEYKVKIVHEDQIDDFAREVEKQAHAFPSND